MSNRKLIEFISDAQESYEAGFYTDDISDALQQAADALEAMEWRQIKHVKNGTSVLFFGNAPHDMNVWFTGFVEQNGKCYSDIGHLCSPIYYMPLPSPPEEE